MGRLGRSPLTAPTLALPPPLAPRLLAGHHRLHTSWAFWYQKKGKRTQTTNWYEGLTLAGRCRTVEQFWAMYSHLIRPDNVEGSVDLMLFRDGIQPMWEDDANKQGGKVSIKCVSLTACVRGRGRRRRHCRLWLQRTTPSIVTAPCARGAVSCLVADASSPRAS